MMDHNQTPDYPSSRDEAFIHLCAETSTSEARLKAGSYLVQNNHYDAYEKVISIFRQMEPELSDNLEWNYCMGYGLVTQHQPAASVQHLLKTLSALPHQSLIYTALCWAFLQIQSWSEAFLSASAGLHNCSENSILEPLKKLAITRMQGHDRVAFNYQGMAYTFRLFTSNTQEIEAAIHHLSAQLTESAELDMIRRHIPQGSAIAEIGCLVGNHSVYFLKSLNPRRMVLIDASQTSLDHTRANLELNADGKACEASYIHCAIGRETGTMEFFGKQVPVKSLSDALPEPVDFIKLDVDGMELEVIDGSADFLRTHRPAIMIEVLHILKEGFMERLRDLGYRIVDQVDHQDYCNYLLVANDSNGGVEVLQPDHLKPSMDR